MTPTEAVAAYLDAPPGRDPSKEDALLSDCVRSLRWGRADELRAILREVGIDAGRESQSSALVSLARRRLWSRRLERLAAAIAARPAA